MVFVKTAVITVLLQPLASVVTADQRSPSLKEKFDTSPPLQQQAQLQAEQIEQA